VVFVLSSDCKSRPENTLEQYQTDFFIVFQQLKLPYLQGNERSSRKSQKGFSSTGYQIRGRLYVYPARPSSRLAIFEK
jgi:hypothetical protein